MEPMEREPVRVVALVSGGVENAVLLKELLAEGHTVFPFYAKAGLSDPSMWPRRIKERTA